MEELSILEAFSQWVTTNWAASTIVGGISWDLVKSHLLIPFKNKLGKYFVDETMIETYLHELQEGKVVNKNKPFRDVEDKYEEIIGRDMPEGFIDGVKEFIIENKKVIDDLNSKANVVFSIRQQNAGRDINNVHGTQIIMNKQE